MSETLPGPERYGFRQRLHAVVSVGLVEKLGVDYPGGDGVHRYPVGSARARERLYHSHLASLGRGVVHVPEERAAVPDDGGREHYPPEFLPAHHQHRLPRAVEAAREVGFDNPVPILVGDFEYVFGLRSAGVVCEYVEPPEFFPDFFEEGGYGFRISDVALHCGRLPSELPDFGDDLFRPVEVAGVPVVDDDARSVSCELDRYPAPDALRGPRDEG